MGNHCVPEHIPITKRLIGDFCFGFKSAGRLLLKKNVSFASADKVYFLCETNRRSGTEDCLVPLECYRNTRLRVLSYLRRTREDLCWIHVLLRSTLSISHDSRIGLEYLGEFSG